MSLVCRKAGGGLRAAAAAGRHGRARSGGVPFHLTRSSRWSAQRSSSSKESPSLGEDGDAERGAGGGRAASPARARRSPPRSPPPCGPRPRRGTPGAITANSSPPIRASRSVERRTPATRSAVWRRTASPTGMAVVVVDRLEVVEVEDEQREGLVVAAAAAAVGVGPRRQLAPQRRVEGAAVGDSGQRVDVGDLALAAPRPRPAAV